MLFTGAYGSEVFPDFSCPLEDTATAMGHLKRMGNDLCTDVLIQSNSILSNNVLIPERAASILNCMLR